MTIPGSVLEFTDPTPVSGTDVDTGRAFVVGVSAMGDHTKPVYVTAASFRTLLGSFVSYGAVDTWLDAFFSAGGKSAYFGRVTHSPVYGTQKIYDQSGSASPGDVLMLATAKSVGAWSTGYLVNVIDGVGDGAYQLQVSDPDDNVLETSPDLLDVPSAVSWSASSNYITISASGSSSDVTPRVQTGAGIASGTDGHGSIDGGDWAAALALFPVDLGAGHVVSPGRYTDDGNNDLVVSASSAQIRIALPAGDPAADKSGLKSAQAAVTATGLGEYSRFCGSTAIIPGLLPGQTRTVDWTAIYAGMCARNDAAGRSPNEPAAGVLGQSTYVLDLTTHWSDVDRGELNDAGVNVAIMYRAGSPATSKGVARDMGNRSGADPVLKPRYIQASNMRELHQLVGAKTKLILDRYAQRQIDPNHTFADLRNDIIGEVLKPEFNRGALYSDQSDPTNPDTSYSVDTGPDVNTPSQVASGVLAAETGIRPSPAAEIVKGLISTRRSDEAVA